MLTNECGFPLIETSDYSSSIQMSMLADMVDSLLERQEAELDYLERPEVALVDSSAASTFSAGAGNQSIVGLDRIVYQSRSSVIVGGLLLLGDWRPGIYHIGTTVKTITPATVNTVSIDLRILDHRGPRLQNEVLEAFRHAVSNSNRGATSLHSSTLVEIHDPGNVEISVFIYASGTGTVTIEDTSLVWIHRVRGLANV